VFCEGEYGLQDVVVGVPVKLGRGGAEQVVEYELTAEERAELATSASAVRELCTEVDRLMA
jgi:malate dehydrogenase